MAYLIYSKRTGVVTRVVNELTTLLPSEGRIICDDDLMYWKFRNITKNLQAEDTLGQQLFDDGSGNPTIHPTDDSGVPLLPMMFQATYPDRLKLPLSAIPQKWTAQQFLAVKYETILASNSPYHCVVGEEFLNDDHIDSGNSDNYIVSSGGLTLAPGGYMQTTAFSFRERVHDAWTLFSFDRIFMRVIPHLPIGITSEYDVSLDNSTWDGFIAAARNTEHNFVDDADDGRNTDTGPPVTSLWRYIRLKFSNNTSDVVELKNYTLLVQRSSTAADPSTPWS